MPDASFTVARVLFLGMAAVGVYYAVQGFGVSDDMHWDDDELTSAVQQATDDLDGTVFQTDRGGSPLNFTDYETLIKDKVTEYSGGDAPQYGVDATPGGANTDADAYFTVTADGADAAFCTHITRTRSKKDDYTPPGITGGDGHLTYPGYRMSADTTEGAC